MATFDIKDFLAHPTVDKLQGVIITKDQWKILAFQYGVTYASSATKQEIQNAVLQHLSNVEIIPSNIPISNLTRADSNSSLSDSDETLQVLDYKLKISESEKARVESEKAKVALEKEKVEAEKGKIEAENEKLKLELQLAQFRHDNPTFSPTDQNHQATFNLSKNSQLLSTFDEKDPDVFFTHFEKLATSLKWERRYWSTLVQCKFVGKARKTYNSLSDTDSKDYTIVKEAVLKAYEQVEETYRVKFRNFTKTQDTYLEFAYELRRHYNKWLTASKAANFDDLKELFLLEQFKLKIPPEIRMYLDEKEVKDVSKAAKLADTYALTHKSGNSNVVTHKSVSVGYKRSVKADSFGSPSDSAEGKSERGSGIQKSTSKHIVCSFCKKPGHHITDCFHPHCKQSKWYKAPTESKQIRPSLNVQVDSTTKDKNAKDSPASKQSTDPPKTKATLAMNVIDVPKHLDPFHDFKSKGTVAIDEHSQPKDITILRDTASAQSILSKDCLPSIETKYTGEDVILQDLSGYPVIPMANIHLSSDLVEGEVKVAVREGPMPVKGVDFILGNDLAGSLVVPLPVVVSVPSTESPTKDLERHDPLLFPTCVVTRSQAKAQTSDVFSTEDYPDLSSLFPDHSVDFLNLPITTDSLIHAQNEDPSLTKLMSLASKESKPDKGTGYFFLNNILMRQYRPVNVEADQDWMVYTQVVVPKPYRPVVLELAHGKHAGHMGINKTCDKILRNFYWPLLRRDVVHFVNSCDTCQRSGKPNQKIPPAPLQPIPIVDQPFEKIILDCVGPLPKTRKGRQYLLTVMCASTRYPEAIALSNIKAKTITSALLTIFTKHGIPRVIQSDRGTNFTSNLFSKVMEELGVTQYLSTAYHPESQGALERFHQTLKSLLKTFCMEHESDWDEGLDLVLFAIRDSKSESMGFSPFQLLYGREIRGPLKVLKETWINNQNLSTSPIQYVHDLKEKLSKMHDFAKLHLSTYQSNMKDTYDQKSCSRSFNPGDQVLVFMPNQLNALQSKFSGPYTVQKKVNDLNYVINTPGKRKSSKLVHINLLKMYHSRPNESDLADNPPALVHSKIVNSSHDISISEPSLPLDNPAIFSSLENHLSYLPKEQCEQLVLLLRQFPHLCTAEPGVCTLVSHDVELQPGTRPVKQAPYRVSPQKRERMKAAVQYLQEHNLIEPSNSPWASPCVLVPKPDGTDRFCTDYRTVNKVTISDSFPLPRLDDLLDTVGNSKFISKIDILRGYYQVPLTPRAKTISAFVTPDGLWQYRYMPFGFKNAPATFQRLMNQVIHGLDGIRVYLDDILVVADSWEEHIQQLEELFGRLSTSGLVINLAKCEFSRATVTYLGHEVGQGKTAPRTAKVEAILNFPVPCDRRGVRRFLGMCGFYRRFCKNFASIAGPLTDLISPKKPFKWSSAAQEAFNNLKSLLASAPVLRAADYDQPFILHVDACDTGVGAVLLQVDPETLIQHPVCYYSTKLLPHQRHYSTIEKETLALILALEKFKFFVQDSGTAIEVKTDHNPITFLQKMKNSNQRLMRWAIALQDYNLEISHIRGKDNILADSLSRGPTDETDP